LNTTQQKKKLRHITWLMAISLLLIFLLVFQWNKSIYNTANNRLHNDVTSLYKNTVDSLRERLIETKLTNILKKDSTSVSNNPKIIVSNRNTSQTTIVKPNGSIRIRRSLDSEPLQIDTTFVLHQETRDINLNTDDLIDDEKDEELRKMLIQIVGKAAVNLKYSDDDNLKEDSVLLAFNNNLKHNYPLLEAYWPKNGATELIQIDSKFKGDRSLAIKGGWPTLFRTLLPQFLFSFVLALLTTLSFIISYRNMKQQLAFNQQKDTFISNISHELKTPLSTTKIALEALSNYNIIEDRVRSKKYLQVANWEINRLDTMIHKVIDTLQSEGATLQLKKASINISNIILEIITSLQPIIHEKKTTILTDNIDSDVHVTGDDIHLLNVMYNLIDNALKYGKDIIEIEVSKSESQAFIRIKDNGSGIPKEYQNKIFEKFFRISMDNTHNVKGHGLGLSYVHYVIHAHQGSIKVEHSNAQGTCFLITLPLNQY
jgi:signal transduction histidine kinase